MAIIFAISSCDILDEDNSTKEEKEVTTIIELPDSVKQKIVAQDSLMMELVNKVDTLTAELNSANKDNAELKDKIDGLEKPKMAWQYMTIFTMLLSFIAIALTLIMCREGRIRDIAEKRLNDSINEGRIHELSGKVNHLYSLQNKNSSNQNNYAPQQGEMRLRNLEGKMDEVERKLRELCRKDSGVNNHRNTASTNIVENKVGYAKVDSDKYFTHIYDSNQEGCAFKITFLSPTKGKFEIISLDKIQSKNDWQTKVKYSGVSINEASNFTVEEYGECEKCDSETWIVTKPLMLKLNK